MIANQYVIPCILVPFPTSFLHDSYIISTYLYLKRWDLIKSKYPNRFFVPPLGCSSGSKANYNDVFLGNCKTRNVISICNKILK